VDEHYINRVFTGQTGTFAFNDTTYKLKIIKVYTQVTNGRFMVDMNFVGKHPRHPQRPDLQITLALSDETTASCCPRADSTSRPGELDLQGQRRRKTAYRVDIQLNRQSTDYYEVTSGLKPG